MTTQPAVQCTCQGCSSDTHGSDGKCTSDYNESVKNDWVFGISPQTPERIETGRFCGSCARNREMWHAEKAP